MYFTQEQINEINDRLVDQAVKDTDLPAINYGGDANIQLAVLQKKNNGYENVIAGFDQLMTNSASYQNLSWSIDNIDEPVDSGTYDYIMDLASSDSLIPSKWYEITDFQTIYFSNGVHLRKTVGDMEVSQGDFWNDGKILGDSTHLGYDGVAHPSVVYKLLLKAYSTNKFYYECRVRANSVISEPERYRLWYDPTPYRDFFGPNHKGTIFRMMVPDRDIDVCFDFHNQLWWRSKKQLEDYGFKSPNLPNGLADSATGIYLPSLNIWEANTNTIRPAKLDEMYRIHMISSFGNPYVSNNPIWIVRGGTTMQLLNNSYGVYNCGDNVLIAGDRTLKQNYGVPLNDILMSPGSYSNTICTPTEIWGLKFEYLCRFHTLINHKPTGDISKIYFKFHSGNGSHIEAEDGISACEFGPWMTSVVIKCTGLESKSYIQHLYVNIASNALIKATSISGLRIESAVGKSAANPASIITGLIHNAKIESLYNSNIVSKSFGNTVLGVLYASKLINSNDTFTGTSIASHCTNVITEKTSGLAFDAFYTRFPLTIKGTAKGQLVFHGPVSNSKAETLDLTDLNTIGTAATDPSSKDFHYVGQDYSSGFSKYLMTYYDADAGERIQVTLTCKATV